MEIFSIEGLMLDGGSIKRIFTDRGEFSRVKKINGENNGFFNSEGRVTGDLELELKGALSLFFSAKKDKQKQEKLKEAVAILIEVLKYDEGYRESWKANIAMAFKDEYQMTPGIGKASINEIANQAADNFLKLLCQ